MRDYNHRRFFYVIIEFIFIFASSLKAGLFQWKITEFIALSAAAAICAALFLNSAISVRATDICDRACLEGAIEKTPDAAVVHNSNRLIFVPNAPYTRNGVMDYIAPRLKPSESIISEIELIKGPNGDNRGRDKKKAKRIVESCISTAAPQILESLGKIA